MSVRQAQARGLVEGANHLCATAALQTGLDWLVNLKGVNMYQHKGSNNALVRFALAVLIGIVAMAGNVSTSHAKEKISKRALQEMITGAKSASDHKAIADYYYAEATKAQAKAVEHDEMAGWYRKAGEGVRKTPYAPGTINHCERLVNDYKSTAADLTALAKEHEAMAKQAK